MTGGDDPGGGPGKLPPGVKRRIHKEVDRNVIMIEVTKQTRSVVNLTWELMGEICEKVGVRIGVETRGYTSQISGDKMEIAISLKQGVSPERFCFAGVKEISQGLTIVSVSPEIKRVVSMRVLGLPFNAPDSIVEEYVEMFGGRVEGQSKMATYSEGPWRGQWNGDRIYSVNMSEQKPRWAPSI